MNPLENAHYSREQWQRSDRFLHRWKEMLPENNPYNTPMHHKAGSDSDQQLRPFVGRITDGIHWNDRSGEHWRRHYGVTATSPFQKMRYMSDYIATTEAQGDNSELARLQKDRIVNFDKVKPPGISY